MQIGELEEKVRNMLMLKFGRLVDLEKLENVTVNRTVEELKEKLRQQESKSAAEIAKWNVSKICSTRIELKLPFALAVSSLVHIVFSLNYPSIALLFGELRGNVAYFKTIERPVTVLTQEGTFCMDMVQDMLQRQSHALYVGEDIASLKSVLVGLQRVILQLS